MKYLELEDKIQGNIFTFLDIIKHFPEQNRETLKVQLSRFAKRGLVTRIKRGLYCFDAHQIDEFELAGRLYQPSYISLETALNFYGMIPDVPQAVIGVTLTTTKEIRNQFGLFSYRKIKPQLYFGFVKVKSPYSQVFFNLAQKEKALLDFFYLRKIKNTADLRLDLGNLSQKLYRQYAHSYPAWVQNIKL